MKRLEETKNLLKQVEADNRRILLQERFAAFRKRWAVRHALRFNIKQKGEIT